MQYLFKRSGNCPNRVSLFCLYRAGQKGLHYTTQAVYKLDLCNKSVLVGIKYLDIKERDRRIIHGTSNNALPCCLSFVIHIFVEETQSSLVQTTFK